MWTRIGFKGEKNCDENCRVNGSDSGDGFYGLLTEVWLTLAMSLSVARNGNPLMCTKWPL